MRGALAVILLALTSGCTPSPGEYLFSGPTMGTSYHVKAVATLSSSGVKSTEDAIQAVLKDLDEKLSNYRNDSELARFNQHASSEPFPLTAETAEVFHIAMQVAEESEGAFDITVSPLVSAWGFGPHPAPAPPDAATLETVRARVGYRLLAWASPTSLIKKRPDVECDLSALGPGYGVDRITQALESRGINRYMVEIGGEVRAKGTNLQGESWRIGMERPASEGQESFQCVLGLQDQSVATSGDYRNYREVDGVRYSHHIDPVTGRPITNTLASVSVLHPQCAYADAYATALTVLGPEKGRAFAEKHHLPAYFITHEGKGFSEHYTSDFPKCDRVP
jgi:FAD:protein FMN transferase